MVGVGAAGDGVGVAATGVGVGRTGVGVVVVGGQRFLRNVETLRNVEPVIARLDGVGGPAGCGCCCRSRNGGGRRLHAGCRGGDTRGRSGDSGGRRRDARRRSGRPGRRRRSFGGRRCGPGWRGRSPGGRGRRRRGCWRNRRSLGRSLCGRRGGRRRGRLCGGADLLRCFQGRLGNRLVRSSRYAANRAADGGGRQHDIGRCWLAGVSRQNRQHNHRGRRWGGQLGIGHRQTRSCIEHLAAQLADPCFYLRQPLFGRRLHLVPVTRDHPG